MTFRRSITALLPLVVLLLCIDGLTHLASAADPAPTPDFERDVAPVLIKRCLECHNQRQAAGGLVLATGDGLKKGGDSGAAIDPADVDASVLLQRVRDGEMPPEQQGRPRKLPDGEIDILSRWIAAGAAWPAGRTLDLYERTSDTRAGRDWWSLQAVARPAVPAVTRSAERVTNPIDAFIFGRLETEGLEPAPPADRATLLRRLSYDLTGLPPTAEELEAFVADRSPDAFERAVDRLLASPHYGERWARYWLDLVRYADTCGYERDQEKPNAWRYRDWVVRALNEDMPYDQFVVEQLAGDELPNRTEDNLIATGFLCLGTWNDEPNDPEDYKYERLEDMVHATTSAFLGLTVKCARCHNHKFDPIPQEDYYRVAAAFWPGPIAPRDSQFVGAATREELGFEKVLGWTDLSAQPAALHLLEKGERAHPGPAVDAGPLTLVANMQVPFTAPAADARTSGRRTQLAHWITDPRNPLTPRVLVNRLWQHHFGQGLVRSPDNFGFMGERPTHPELLDWLAAELVEGDFKIKRLHKLILMSSTWRQASNHPRHDEFAGRDPANRLWWRAERRRLDAEALRDSMLAAAGELDLDMGGEAFKPTIVAEALEGLSMKSNAWQESPPEHQLRRSLYMYAKRGLLPPLMTTFDFSDTTLPCAQRDVTTVAPQALAMLNDPFIHQRSTSLARRVADAVGDERAEQIRAIWRFALGRSPTEEELTLADAHLAAQRKRFAAQEVPVAANPPSAASAAVEPATPELLALASLCHVLINSNEFLYID